jgi:mycothiol synthase
MTNVHPHPALKESLVGRFASMADLEALTDLFNAYRAAAYGERPLTLEHMRSQLTTPGLDIESSIRVVATPAGRLVGCIAVVDLHSPPVHPQAIGCVHPDFERQGIGTYLIHWAEQRARQAIIRVPDGLRVSLYLDSSSTHEPTKRLFLKLGLKPIRHSWLMLIDLEQSPPETRWPAGLALKTYRDLPDLRAVYRATDDAFQDHWGYVEQSEEAMLRWWRHEREQDPDFDPSLWFLVMDGDEIAAMALCRPKGPGDNYEMGFVNTLGVRRPWRRRGLALALLQHTFGEFHRRGKKQVGLEVDAGSLTGATRLYEKAGMAVARQVDTYEKELRPGRELAKRSLEDT